MDKLHKQTFQLDISVTFFTKLFQPGISHIVNSGEKTVGKRCSADLSSAKSDIECNYRCNTVASSIRQKFVENPLEKFFDDEHPQPPISSHIGILYKY